MPKPTCVQCSTNDSLLWRNQENGQICNDCYLSNTASKDADDLEGKDDEDSKNGKNEGESTPAKATGKGTRKSTRATRYKARPTPAPGPAPRPTPGPRGRGRRSLFKRPPLKAPTATATLVTSDYVFHKGIYMQVGDIVSLEDIDGGTFYAQIRGFLTDQYCEKSAVLTWLLPTRASPPPAAGFHPATYILGVEEELPRKLDCMEFVMRAPSDYYRAGDGPYPPTHTQLENYTGYIWTSLEPKENT